MAVRKTGAQKTRNSRKKPSGKDDRAPISMIFWVLFFIILITAFFVLLPKVKKDVNIPPKTVATEEPTPEKPPDPGQNSQSEKPPAAKSSEKPPVDKPPAAPAKETPKEKTTPEKPPADKSPGQTPSPPKTQQPATQPVEKPAEKPVETRDRTIYFMRESDMLLTKANRKLKVSDSPMLDCLNALIAGPTAEEKNRGLVSFMPSGTRLISAQVRQNTAYLNFNEEFRYNTLGREGCAAQLKQIVWTATEFPTVHDVQILIEGQTVDFLMEGIMIRNPIGR